MCSFWACNKLTGSLQFVSLESACVKFLTCQAPHLGGNGLLSLAQLADHLGLSSLLETAAEYLIKLPWHIYHLNLLDLLYLSVYRQDTDKRKQLLHHPERGAVTELQVLLLLECMSISRADCASFLELQRL